MQLSVVSFENKIVLVDNRSSTLTTVLGIGVDDDLLFNQQSRCTDRTQTQKITETDIKPPLILLTFLSPKKRCFILLAMDGDWRHLLSPRWTSACSCSVREAA